MSENSNRWLWVRHAPSNGDNPGPWKRLCNKKEGKWAPALVQWAVEEFSLSREAYEEADTDLWYADWAMCEVAGTIDGAEWRMDWASGTEDAPDSENPEDLDRSPWVPDGTDFYHALEKLFAEAK